MKDFRCTLFFLALTVAIFSCKKKEEPTVYDEIKDRNMGVVTAMINGTPWAGNLSFVNLMDRKDFAQISAKIYQGDYLIQSLSVSNFCMTDSNRQKIYPSLDSNGIQIATNLDSARALFATNNDDAFEAVYEIFDNGVEEDYIIVDSFDPKSKNIRGRFRLTVYTRDRPTQGFSDTLRITDGYFDLTHKSVQ